MLVIGNEENFKWDQVLLLVQPVRLHYHNLAEGLMSSNHLLTLYTLALKESQNQLAYPDVLSTLVQCLESVKPKLVHSNNVYICFMLYNIICQQCIQITVFLKNC